ncbi:MAG: malto-oligosyltrehalose synthase, partial [Jatrophihabitans sp.]
MSVPASTVRLQLNSSFDLYAAARVCDHLADLGAGGVYLSPLLPSERSSDHGYDVVRFDTVDPARGGPEGWARLLAAAHARGLRVVLDIVPNHTGVTDASQNPAWQDLLRLGRSSPYAPWFDVDWAPAGGRVLLPVLGDRFDASRLTVGGDELDYAGQRFPIAPGTGSGTPEQVLEAQHYALVERRRADTEQNYRRFFAVSTLAGLRVEDPDVFAATHEQVGRWLREDRIDGLRVDHPDGLADPRGYLARLRELAGPGAWIVVEKILEPGERLPPDWPVDGTTGYDALAEVGGLFVDPAAEPALDAGYRSLTGDGRDYAAHVEAGKRTA